MVASRTLAWLAVPLAFPLVLPAAALLQPPAKPAAQPPARATSPAVAPRPALAPVTLDSAFLSQYRWRNIGPDRGGRSIAASGVKGRKNEAYFGATGGGLWKTIDAGENWFPVTDGHITSASVGAVAVSESHPDVVYIGMGESAIRGNIMPGDGIYKSSDAGKTWKHLGFRTVDAISKIRVHPTNPDIVFAAVLGKYSVPSEERGVYKSTDGGTTWKRVLFKDAKSGAVDIVLDRANPRVLYATLWEAYRKEYQMSSGGPGSGLYKSTDGGDTWTEITRASGLPSGLVGRIGVAVTAANPNRVYALIENENGGLFKSDDAGATWTLMNSDRNIRQRAFYYTHLYADHKNADRVYIQNVSFFRSDDAGKTITSIGQGSHADWHDLWVDPDDAEHLVAGNDGGGTVTFNGGKAYTAQDFPTEQWYHVITTKHVPFHVCGSQQDNSTLCTPMNWNMGRQNAEPGQEAQGGVAVSYQVGGGEPGYIAPDPLDLDVFYAGTNNGGYVDKFNKRTGLSREVNPYPWFYSGEPSKEIRERWQWTFPILFSQVDPKLLFVSSQRLWATRDGGRTWMNLSGDLTRHAPETQEKSGGPITGDMNGPEVYGTIFSVGPSKKDVNTIFTGSDDGLVFVTRNFGKTWTNITPKDMPDFGRVSQLDASSHDAGTVYMSVRRPLLNDRAPYIFKTTDYGRTWTKIVNGLGAEDYVHAVREDPTRRGLLYAATQHGVYISYDDGAQWQRLNLNLPDVPVADLIVERDELVIGTHGRGFWVLDNITPLRQATPTVLAASSHLYAPVTGLRSSPGVTLNWRFATKPKRAMLAILDSTGTVVREYTGDTATATAGAAGGRRRGTTATFPITAGLSRFTFDLRSTGLESFPGMILWGAGTAGPALPPGRYSVRLTADGQELKAPLTIRRSPLVADVTDADLRAQYAFGKKVRDKTNEAQRAVIEIRRVKDQLTDRLKRATDDAALKSKGEVLRTNASGVEENVYQVKNQSGQDPLNFPIKVNNRLANLLAMAERGDGTPGTYMPEILDILTKELAGYQRTLEQVWKTDLTAVNTELTRLKLPLLDPKCTVVTGCGATP
ncbi:MAG TPA: glycosyl hydrolase [Gemmatimonas aurantiaca]|uniref:Glycosyl hydrolase n=1 Tax=Gemmatimonas aurantiaca TaxID=173480 RepID=A0A3D4V6F6_9BACT|nr:glycosyl hydrolase [Gemmatimonas aurantiaca]HCT56729.1 glycosyl hydrolase [Gemmatimonas aurantiaca]